MRNAAGPQESSQPETGGGRYGAPHDELRPLGFEKIGGRSHGQPIYRRGNEYIWPDTDSHRGGVWKGDRQSRQLPQPDNARRDVQRRSHRESRRMRVLEINKYPPSMFKQGRFLKEDWTSCMQVGPAGSGARASRDEYLAVEGRYVRAVRRFMRLAGVDAPIGHSVEHWDTESETLRAAALDDVLDGQPAVQDGDVIEAGRLENVVRRCLRELAWLELVRPRSFLVHFGYDLRLIVALEADADAAIAETQADGLFVYPGNTRLPTLDAWRAADAQSRKPRKLPIVEFRYRDAEGQRTAARFVLTPERGIVIVGPTPPSVEVAEQTIAGGVPGPGGTYVKKDAGMELLRLLAPNYRGIAFWATNVVEMDEDEAMTSFPQPPRW